MDNEGRWERGPNGPDRGSAVPLDTGREGDARSSIREETARATGEKADELKEKAVRKTDELTSRVGSRVETVARALRRASEDMRNEGESRFAEMTDRAAGRVERFGSYLGNQDPREMMSDIERTARSHPAYFVAGSFAAGLLLGRFLRSSEPEIDGSDAFADDEIDWSDTYAEDAPRDPAFGEGR